MGGCVCEVGGVRRGQSWKVGGVREGIACEVRGVRRGRACEVGGVMRVHACEVVEQEKESPLVGGVMRGAGKRRLVDLLWSRGREGRKIDADLAPRWWFQ